MDSRLFFGLCVSAVFLFIRYRWPAVPKPLATFGICLGVGLAAWSFTAIPVGLALSFILNAAILIAVADYYFWGRAPRTQQEVDASERDRKRKLIDRGRSLAATFTQGHTGYDSFRHYLEGTKSYPAIRPYLSREYLDKLNDGRTIHAMADGARYEPLVEWFLDEVDRLEREWKLS